MRLIDDAERRARMARRHALAPQHLMVNAHAATWAMMVLHATEAAVALAGLRPLRPSPQGYSFVTLDALTS